MTDDAILKQVINSLGQIGEETGKEAIKQIGEVTSGVISGQELLGIKPMDDNELAKKKAEDEAKRQQELNELRAKMGSGRNVGQEIEQIRDEREQAEKQKEKQEQEQAERQRQEEMQQQQMMVEAPGNQKRQAAKMQNAPGKRKKQQPDPTQMSQTSEFKGGKID